MVIVVINDITDITAKYGEFNNNKHIKYQILFLSFASYII